MKDEQHVRPSERFSGNAGAIDLEQDAADLLERSARSDHARAERTLYRHEGVTIALFALQRGAMLPPHTADGVVSVHVLMGRVRMSVGSERFDLPSGQLLRLAPGLTHDLHAVETSVVLVHIALLGPKRDNV